MSILLPYKPISAFNDFIESIEENFENNEGFGKDVSGDLNFKNFKKACSYRDFKGTLSFEDRTKKSFSTSSFQENDYEQQCYYGKSPTLSSRRMEDQSTMASFSSLSSFNSHCSAMSAANVMNPANSNNNKSKSKPSGGKKKNPGEVDFRKKYKTEVCKYWAEYGYCEFGDQCAFAHGNQEIRQKQHISSNYKTKKCNQFHETGYCPYGVRCQFVHSLRRDCPSNSSLVRTAYLEAMENPELWFTHDPDCVCMQRKTRRRLPSFQQVSTSNSSNDELGENDSMGEKYQEDTIESMA
jgi:hypothetical protein